MVVKEDRSRVHPYGKAPAPWPMPLVKVKAEPTDERLHANVNYSQKLAGSISDWLPKGQALITGCVNDSNRAEVVPRMLLQVAQAVTNTKDHGVNLQIPMDLSARLPTLAPAQSISTQPIPVKAVAKVGSVGKAKNGKLG